MRLAALDPKAIHLEVGQPDLPTPPHVIEAAHAAALAGQTTYTPNPGTNALRDAVAERQNRVFGLNLEAGNILVTPGAMTAVILALYATLDPGDEILVPDPGFPNYAAMIELVGAKGSTYDLRIDDDGIDLVALERLVGPRTKALLINGPGNPTGQVFSARHLAAIVDFARRHGLFLISDEIYDELVFDTKPVSALQFDTDGRVLAISGVSKVYSMTGWRIGWLVAAPEVITHATRFVEALYSCPSSVSQAAALAALTGSQDCVQEMMSVYRERARLIERLLGSQGVLVAPPRGAFYAMVDISSAGMSSDTFARRLLADESVAVAPGATFSAHGDGWVRLSFVNGQHAIEEGSQRILRYLRRCATG